MRLGGEGLLLRRRRRGNSIRTTVEAGVVIIDDRRVVYDRCVHKGRPNHGRIHVHRSRVVCEDATEHPPPAKPPPPIRIPSSRRRSRPVSPNNRCGRHKDRRFPTLNNPVSRDI